MQNKSWMMNPRPAVELTGEGRSSIIISIHPRSRSGMTSLKRSAQKMTGYEAQWISSAILALDVPEHLAKPLPARMAENLREAIKEVFLTEPNPRWWWEHLSGETVSWHTDNGWSYISDLCPNEVCFFVPLEEHGNLIYESSPETIKDILGDCPAFEYAVVSKRYEWILIENHHNVLVASGEPLLSNLTKTKAEQGEDTKPDNVPS